MRIKSLPHTFSLKHLADINIVHEFFRYDKLPLHVFLDQLCSAWMFLVGFKDTGYWILVTGSCKGIYCFHRGHPLKPILTHKSPNLQSIHLKRFVTPPNTPVMHIALRICFTPSPAGHRRGRPVDCTGIKCFNYLRKDVMKNFNVIIPNFCRIFFRISQLLLPAPVLPAFIHLVVSAPEGNAWMIRQAADIINGFSFNT